VTAQRPSVGFVGAGRLGEPTVGRLAAAGWQPRVFVRRAEVRERLTPLDVELVETLDALATCNVVIVFVFSDQQLADVLLGGGLLGGGLLAATRPGATVVVHTTASLSMVHALVDAAPAGVSVVDAPVSGTEQHIRDGRLTVLVGGTDAAVAAVMPVLDCYANPVVHVGEVGAVMKVKLVNNVLFAANVQLVGAAAAVAADLGLDVIRTLQALSTCSGASTALGYINASGDLDAFARGIATYLRKDVAAALETAESSGIDLGRLGDVAKGGPFDLA
jgi:3-hydroxyisobutyrate dehydrogenase-like beta-hydroxyacid dehydrogenase